MAVAGPSQDAAQINGGRHDVGDVVEDHRNLIVALVPEQEVKKVLRICSNLRRRNEFAGELKKAIRVALRPQVTDKPGQVHGRRVALVLSFELGGRLLVRTPRNETL